MSSESEKNTEVFSTAGPTTFKATAFFEEIEKEIHRVRIVITIYLFISIIYLSQHANIVLVST